MNKDKKAGSNSLPSNWNKSRREFIKTAAGLSTFMIVPRHVLGGAAYVAPSDKINIAAVGAGGKGRSDIKSVAHENIYAICDIDDNRLADTLGQEWAAPFKDKTKTYRDYRIMLENEPEIDAVVISTPDHMHTPIAGYAMNMGKHLYIQKPLHTPSPRHDFWLGGRGKPTLSRKWVIRGMLRKAHG
tara:strand:- start:397 stop:954 length:558 start_codon:yes stop_codon:yes gene_type:complete